MSLPPGAVFAGFTIERLLGAGGMGTVYLAGHPRLQRRVALKVLADTFSVDPKTRNAFDREATLAAGLDHPNIVSVYDRSAPDDPALWLAMRYIGGGDASALLDEHPRGLAPDRAVRLVADAAHALDYAHAQGVLHRDVKPANLLIENNHRHGEHAVLTDFGIARTLDDTVTLSGIAATFAYAAPERFSDAPADHRSDIYSLGCTLHQLLTAQPPYPRKDQAAVIGAHLTAPPPSPHAIRPDLPAELDAVIATALAKSPQDRYPTCTALAEAAARALSASVVTVRPESPRPVTISNGTAPDEVAIPPVPPEPAATIIREPMLSAQDEAAVPTVLRNPVSPVRELAAEPINGDESAPDQATAATIVHGSVSPVSGEAAVAPVVRDSVQQAPELVAEPISGHESVLDEGAVTTIVRTPISPVLDEAAVAPVVRDPAQQVSEAGAAPIIGREAGPDERVVATVVRSSVSPVVDEAAIATDIRDAAPVGAGVVQLEKGWPPASVGILEPTAERSTRRRRLGLVSGLVVAGVSVVVGGTLAMRGNSESPSVPTSSVVVSQPVTSTPSVQSSVPTTIAPSTVDAPPPEDTTPPIANVPPAEQSVPTYNAPRPQTPVQQAPVIVPQTRVHQWPG